MGLEEGENSPPRGIVHYIRAPEEAVTPRSRRCIEASDTIGDVVSHREHGVGEATKCLIHPNDIRASLECRPVELIVGGKTFHRDVVGDQELDQPLCLGITALPFTHRNHMSTRVLGHVVVIRSRPDDGKRFRQLHPGPVLNAAPVDLELVEEHVVPVGDDELERRPNTQLLGSQRPKSAQGCGCNSADSTCRIGAIAHLDGRRVGADQLGVYGGVERSPVVPALWETLAGRNPPAGNIVNRSGDAEAFGCQRGLIGIEPLLVPPEENVVLDAWVVGHCRSVEQSGRYVAVKIQGFRRQPLGEYAYRCAGFRLGLGDVITVEVESVAVRPYPRDASVGILDHVEKKDRVIQDRVDLGIGSVGSSGQFFNGPASPRRRPRIRCRGCPTG
jgi:hypothetical protein